MSITVNSKDVTSMLNSMQNDIAHSWKDTHEFMVKKTPRDTGNARRNTVHRSNAITADYAYAARLDAGYSKQAPDGFTDDTVEYFERAVDSMAEKYNGQRNRSSSNSRY